MAESSPLAFSFRDILRRIFPSVIAICLFAPLFTRFRHLHSIQEIIFAGIVLSYLMSFPVRKGSDLLFDKSPFWRQRRRKLKTKREWINRNWDYQRLDEHLTKDERELIDEDGNLAYFYRIICFYLLLYLLVLLVLFLIRGFHFDLARLPQIPTLAYWKGIWLVIVNSQTALLGLGELPLLVVVPLTVILIYFSFKEAFQAYEYTFLDGGAYPSLSEKYHREKGEIAVSIWGQVVQREDGESQADIRLMPAAGAEARLLLNNKEIEVSKTDEEGYFQFADRFSQCLDKTCVVTVQVGVEKQQQTRIFSRTTKPSFTFEFPGSIARKSSKGVTALLKATLRGIAKTIFMSTDEKIKDLINATNPPHSPEVSKTYSRSSCGHELQQGVRRRRFSDHYSEKAVATTLRVLDPAIAALRPGALVGVKSLENCDLTDLDLKRASGVLTFESLMVSDQAAARDTKELSPLTSEAVQGAVNEFAVQIGTGIPRTSYLAQQFYSLSHALHIIGASRSWLKGDQAQKLNFLQMLGMEDLRRRYL